MAVTHHCTQLHFNSWRWTGYRTRASIGLMAQGARFRLVTVWVRFRGLREAYRARGEKLLLASPKSSGE